MIRSNPFAAILLAGLPEALPPKLIPKLTLRELSRCVELIGKGLTLQQALDRIQAERPTLPFSSEAA